MYEQVLIGTTFIDGNLNAEKNEGMFLEHIVPEIQNAVCPNDQNIWFQENSTLTSLRFSGKSNGRRDSIEWPSRSPDFSPLDYFL